MSSFPPPGDAAPPPGDSDPGPTSQQSWGAPTGDAPTSPRPAGAATGWTAPPTTRATVPLRPLGLGDMFDGAFRTIRQNPGATLGVAFLVNLVFLAIPAVGLALLSLSGQLGPLVPDVASLEAGTAEPFGTAPVVSGLLTFLASTLAGVVVTGLVVQVVARAAIGEKLRAGEAWRRTRPRLWRLLGLTIVSGLLPLVATAVVVGVAVAVTAAAGTVVGALTGVVLGVGAFVAVVWFWTRFFLLAPCVLVLEGSGVVASARRSRTLSRGSFWRLLGIYLLISVTAYLVASIVSIPLSLIGVASLFLLGDDTWGTVLVLVSDNLSAVVSGALATPFVGAVVALQYIDVRIRREGLDVRLRQQAARRAQGGQGGEGGQGGQDSPR
ncbi:hypothetical protein KLP28_09095 [Nocardioidaceae bacterium]|nr:hypothetical protein KLP28_09095 [Nocardioidaceae bacterium]